jgi:NTE family protein
MWSSIPIGFEGSSSVIIPRVALGLTMLALAACQTSQVVMNRPLAKDNTGAPIYTPGYTLTGLLHDPKGPILLALAFSGGGKRSAAFAHGALRGLRAMQVIENGRARSLLDDVNYIASVSGGSFPAMHYGLYRDRSFKTFPDDFLKRDINAYIFGIYLLPWNWEWLINPLFGTNDAMAAVYDRLMFHGATYADLMKQGLPMISVNATDIAGGISFPINQASFDLLCSDLASFPVARAVAASNGFPVLFTPITLTSYRRDCTRYPPPGAPAPGWDKDTGTLSRRSVLARNAERQMDPDRTQYLHLMDGGIADNLALRSLSNALILLDQQDDILRRLAATTRRVIVISVDGQAAANPTLGQRRVLTGLGQIFRAVSGTQIDAYNFETLLLADQQIQELTDHIRRIRCEQGKILDGHDCGDVKGALIQLSLAGIANVAERKRLQAIPTGLTIPDADVDTLVAQGEKLIQTDPTLLGLITNLDARPGATVAANSLPPRRPVTGRAPERPLAAAP